jgi:hypothetical protein
MQAECGFTGNELTEYAAFRKWETVETYGDKMSGAKDRLGPATS